ncbi:Stk1 family PASTA domain-containing Ser/Thr kinase [Mycobacterium bourgelatii]|uniref:Stk1 family PASTA domain-containing Ser/Thr kinase n=1 Tax=Mycobacterium bourgelatii TaxID=1273442 RepID=UPI0013D5D9AB|nr:PASTA domain-containing protein [Mycobacterium bourgelatii]MCV6977157.1 PASTA domain-containing protein [Mycobacterium bourgelatii]
MRFVVGWCFEVIYIAGLLALFLTTRDRNAVWAAEEAQRTAEVTASGVVYQTQHGRSVVYRHGTCTVNHRSPEAASNCRKSELRSTIVESQPPRPYSHNAVTAKSPATRPAVIWPAVIVGVGLIVGLVILLADPIHRIPSPAEQARSKPCPVPISINDAPANITMPDLVGQNAGSVETRLKGLGLTTVELSSANPKYKSVWVASNWTVVSTDPNPGCIVGPYNSVVVYVTKP